MELTKEFLVA